MAEPCADNEPHLHDCNVAVYVRGCALYLDQQIAALFPESTRPIAERCVQLLQRHGLADIPDGMYPPPDPTTIRPGLPPA